MLWVKDVDSIFFISVDILNSPPHSTGLPISESSYLQVSSIQFPFFVSSKVFFSTTVLFGWRKVTGSVTGDTLKSVREDLGQKLIRSKNPEQKPNELDQNRS